MSKNKKAVITILGIQGGYVLNGKAHINNKKHLATYYFENDKKKRDYFNTLPLLYERYSKDYEIIPLYTDDAKIFNEEVISEIHKEIDIKFDKKYHIKDEKNFNEIFRLYNTIIESMDEVIVDITHGFRHLPLLMIIELMIINFRNIDKIKHIYFAKEIKKHTKDNKGEYEIIDLIEYLELAKLSFILTIFNENYTIGNRVLLKEPKYQDLIDNLRVISSHILANSIQTLIKGDNNLISQTINQLKIMKEDENIQHFSKQIDEIINHLKYIEELKYEKDYIRLFKFAKLMQEREYLLNSITLLNESIGLYCANKIANISDEIKQHIDNYIKSENVDYYKLAHQSRNIIKNPNSFKGDYLYEPNKQKMTSSQKKSLQKKKKGLKQKIPNSILDEIEKAGFKIELSKIDNKKDRTIKDKIIEELNGQDNKKLVDLIISVEKLRNNLAHGNSSDKIENVKGEITKCIREFQTILDEN